MLNRLWPALHRVEFAALNVLRAVAEALVNDDLHPVFIGAADGAVGAVAPPVAEVEPERADRFAGQQQRTGGIVAAARRADAQVRVIRRA